MSGVYSLAQIARELERTALGNSHYGNALRVAKDIPGLTDDDRALLDRYATGRNSGTDHVALQDLALRIRLVQAAAPVASIEVADAQRLADDLEALRQAHWTHWTAQENHVAAVAVRHLRLLAAHNASLPPGDLYEHSDRLVLGVCERIPGRNHSPIQPADGGAPDLRADAPGCGELRRDPGSLRGGLDPSPEVAPGRVEASAVCCGRGNRETGCSDCPNTPGVTVAPVRRDGLGLLTLEGDCIVMRFTADAAAFSYANDPRAHEPRPPVIDKRVFLRDVFGALTKKREDGSTRLTDALDWATTEAMEQGSEGIGDMPADGVAGLDGETKR